MCSAAEETIRGCFQSTKQLLFVEGSSDAVPHPILSTTLQAFSGRVAREYSVWFQSHDRRSIGEHHAYKFEQHVDFLV
jgi:hypothetical protein